MIIRRDNFRDKFVFVFGILGSVLGPSVSGYYEIYLFGLIPIVVILGILLLPRVVSTRYLNLGEEFVVLYKSYRKVSIPVSNILSVNSIRRKKTILNLKGNKTLVIDRTEFKEGMEDKFFEYLEGHKIPIERG